MPMMGSKPLEFLSYMKKRNEVYGLSRSRDRKGKVIKRSLNPFVNCIHTMAGGGWDTMEILVVEVYEKDNVLQRC